MSLDKKILTEHEQNEYEEEIKLVGQEFIKKFNEKRHEDAMNYFNRLNSEAQNYIKKHPKYHWALLVTMNEMNLR